MARKRRRPFIGPTRDIRPRTMVQPVTRHRLCLQCGRAFLGGNRGRCPTCGRPLPNMSKRDHHIEHLYVTARTLAAARGHYLERFAKLTAHTFQARCARCKEWVEIFIGRDAVPIQGSALATDCEGEE